MFFFITVHSFLYFIQKTEAIECRQNSVVVEHDTSRMEAESSTQVRVYRSYEIYCSAAMSALHLGV
jgi:hypothetical protein